MEKIFHVRAFTKDNQGGNLAGVCIHADHLTEQEMLRIANSIGYSETAFVLKSDVADFRVRFFTPVREVDLCGHATIATFHVLREQQLISCGLYTQETKAGILKLDVSETTVFMQQNKPQFEGPLDIHAFNECFTGYESDLRLKPFIVSTGIREIFLPVKNLEILNRLVPVHNQIKLLSKQHDVIGIHAFALSDEVDAYGRNFAPIVGIDEESATGTSNGALACYLYQFSHPKDGYILRQGYSMDLPSEIYVKIKIIKNEIEEVWVGGSATSQVSK